MLTTSSSRRSYNAQIVPAIFFFALLVSHCACAQPRTRGFSLPAFPHDEQFNSDLTEEFSPGRNDGSYSPKGFINSLESDGRGEEVQPSSNGDDDEMQVDVPLGYAFDRGPGRNTRLPYLHSNLGREMDGRNEVQGSPKRGATPPINSQLLLNSIRHFLGGQSAGRELGTDVSLHSLLQRNTPTVNRPISFFDRQGDNVRKREPIISRPSEFGSNIPQMSHVSSWGQMKNKRRYKLQKEIEDDDDEDDEERFDEDLTDGGMKMDIVDEEVKDMSRKGDRRNPKDKVKKRFYSIPTSIKRWWVGYYKPRPQMDRRAAQSKHYGCLKRCIDAGKLHPIQCHTLC